MSFTNTRPGLSNPLACRRANSPDSTPHSSPSATASVTGASQGETSALH